MEGDKKKELYNLSSQFMDIFINDLLTKNNVNIGEAKKKLTNEQRESLKETVEHLKAEVDDFLESSGKKEITEKDKENQKTESPLREKIKRKKESDKD